MEQNSARENPDGTPGHKLLSLGLQPDVKKEAMKDGGKNKEDLQGERKAGS